LGRVDAALAGGIGRVAWRCAVHLHPFDLVPMVAGWCRASPVGHAAACTVRPGRPRAVVPLSAAGGAGLSLPAGAAGPPRL